MQYLAAYTLATLSGKEPSTNCFNLDEQTLTAILNVTGKPVDAAQVTAVVNSLKGKQVHEVPNINNYSSLPRDNPKLVQLVDRVLLLPRVVTKKPRRKKNQRRNKNPRNKKRNQLKKRKKTSILICSVDHYLNHLYPVLFLMYI